MRYSGKIHLALYYNPYEILHRRGPFCRLGRRRLHESDVARILPRLVRLQKNFHQLMELMEVMEKGHNRKASESLRRPISFFKVPHAAIVDNMRTALQI